MYFWLCWAFVSVRVFSSCVNGGCCLAEVCGASLRVAFLLQSTSSSVQGLNSCSAQA